ncbi:hypothetical protein ACU19_08560 [Actinobaculum suis]|uniref:hypothetical protein n=1 Tax=Actinobaculum suis TaxID=1657 RepID=UPI00066FF41D|nr:hypothetical protein [Actinobaculum suis]KMY22732.1 hypothetical protein ACU19_08560 [Actinobaculum suis]
MTDPEPNQTYSHFANNRPGTLPRALTHAYIRAHGIPAALIVIPTICLAIILLGERVTVHSWVAGGVTPLARLLTVGIPVVAVTTVFPGFEAAYHPLPRRRVTDTHAAISLLTVLGIGLGLGAYMHEPNLLALPRLFAFWWGLAIISAAIGGKKYTWVIPSLIALGSGFFFPPEETSVWNVVMSQVDSWQIYTLVGAVLLLAGLLYRKVTLRSRISQRR